MSKRPQSRKNALASQNPWLVPFLIAAGVLVLFIVIAQFTRSEPAAGGAAPPRVLQFDNPPPMTIDPAREYTATLRTEKGDIVIELLPDKAPITVNNFVFLARQGYYDGSTFHRVLPDFMAQGGDPTGTGSGGPGYTFQDEISDLEFDSAGLLAMANAGPNTNGSQFFITYGPAPHLNGNHTIFGRVTAGMDVALALSPRDPRLSPATPGDRIETITIVEQ